MSIEGGRIARQERGDASRKIYECDVKNLFK